MIKAFLFDMDGVIVDSEHVWVRSGADQILIEMFGKELWEKYFKIPMGLSIKGMYDIAIAHGVICDYQEYNHRWFELAEQVYRECTLSEGVEELINYLCEKNIVVGVVSGSPKEWVEMVIQRLANKEKIQYRLSVNDHPILKPKPASDPYLQALRDLKVDPSECIVLEDSKSGVASAVASGCKIICYTEHNSWGTPPRGAMYYAGSMAKVIEIVNMLLSTENVSGIREL
jgi:beta-phosphoglucomutase-like phosphatase (HAD superfamily)